MVLKRIQTHLNVHTKYQSKKHVSFWGRNPTSDLTHIWFKIHDQVFQTLISDWAYPNLFYTDWPITKLFTWHPVRSFFLHSKNPETHQLPLVPMFIHGQESNLCLRLFVYFFILAGAPIFSTLTGSWLQVKTTTSKRQMALASIYCSFITICTPSTQRSKNFWSVSIHRWNFIIYQI